MQRSPPSVGDIVDLSLPCKLPPKETMHGTSVELRPLEGAHVDQLYLGMSGEEYESTWDYMGIGPFDEVEGYRSFITGLLELEKVLLMTMVDKKTNEYLGFAGYVSFDDTNRSIELGATVSPKGQRSTATTETWYLLTKKAFELGYRRVEWKCDALNKASRQAAIRFGFTLEGIFRQHRIVRGRNRDTAWLSLIDKEWPLRKLAAEKWLDASNFDENGRQKMRLEDIRTQLEDGSRRQCPGSDKNDCHSIAVR